MVREFIEPPEHGKGVLGDLQIDSDMAFSHREWAVERMAWVAMAMILVLAFVGVFGSGPAAWGVARSEGGLLEVRYPRFTRFDARVRLGIDVAPEAARGGIFQIEMSRDYLQDFRIDSMVPDPDSVESAGATVRYRFLQAEEGAGLTVSLSMAAEGRGWVDAMVDVPGDKPVVISQFIYP